MTTPASNSIASLIHIAESYVDPLPVERLFTTAQPLEVELGAGDGSFIAQYASLRRDHNFIAVERLLGRLRKIDRKGRRAGLINLLGMRIEASYFLRYLLPPASVSALHVYFPDPWPKRRHRKNRLIHQPFAVDASKALQPGGVVYLRTDNADYFVQMQEVFAANPAFEEVATPPELASVTTDFERHFNAQGIPTLRAAYRLR